ncbi:MAG: hypothetical protein VB085_09520 [Peptococcaceae bacterium]|nr:hypothetical protein [Peptococcaceae bacterium]
MLLVFLFWLFMLSVIFLSLWLRGRKYKRFWRSSYGDSPMEPLVSPLSLAVGNLISVAGGIYVSLELLCEFLHLPKPSDVRFLEYTLDPIALVSVWAAILQPFVLKIASLFSGKSKR